MRRRKSLLTVALLGALTLVGAACADEAGPNQPGGQGAQATCQQDEFGCVQYGAGEPIKLGGMLTISGDTATLGQDSANGVRLAIDNLDGRLDGREGQLLGRSVSFNVEDSLCTAEGGQAAGTRVAADPKIVAVVGTSCSSEALGVADRILSDKGIVLISPSNTNPNLTAEGTHQPFYARTAHNDKIQGAIVANYAYDELGARTAATINDESPYADALAAVFRQVFQAKGGQIVAEEAIQSTDKDFKPLLTRIGQGQPDVLYHPNFNPACGLVVKQGRPIAGLKDTTFIGSDGCAAPDYGQVAGGTADGTFLSSPDLSGFTEAAFYKDQFLPQYREQFGSAPTASFHAHAYDAANILFDAIEQVAIREGDNIFIPRTALKDAVLQTRNYRGVTGTISCNPLGDCAAVIPIALYEVPNDPFVGEKTDAKPVFSQTLSLQEAEQLAGGS
ncbi:MAG TPA: branched-chain amino acid ABC transporter substrate-binding protein [Actinomycetota bacterium]|nr:branched-chain amino acid ABC transporter substrate-binding protein [Actinomycetota bacterium]